MECKQQYLAKDLLALFGGYFYSAAIDWKGGIMLISIDTDPDFLIEPSYLPDHEKAVEIAFEGTNI